MWQRWKKGESHSDIGRALGKQAASIHETIYRTLFIQARGALKKELVAHFRTSEPKLSRLAWPPKPEPVLHAIKAGLSLRCPSCGGRMRVLSAITDPSVARRILQQATQGAVGPDAGMPLGHARYEPAPVTMEA